VAGETRLGPFVIERELGRGGMGVVYAARHDGRQVALKVSLEDIPGRDKKHFLQEAELLSRIAHPGIVEILASGTLDDGRPYLVMPLLAGRTLAERLQRGRIEPDLALRLFAQLAGAVAVLHDAGIVHRDIKPENVIYLEDEERLVLLDFGIARDIDRPASTTTRMNLVRGTPGFMAPERFFGTPAARSRSAPAAPPPQRWRARAPAWANRRRRSPRASTSPPSPHPPAPRLPRPLWRHPSRIRRASRLPAQRPRRRTLPGMLPRRRRRSRPAPWPRSLPPPWPRRCRPRRHRRPPAPRRPARGGSDAGG
jgi:serine/threonine protein kinase